MTSVEGLIFWLVPVILLVVFTLIITNHARDPVRRKLLFVEPLGSLIPTWRPVRLIGDASQLRQALAWLAQSRLTDGSPLEHLLADHDAAPVGDPSALLHRQPLGPWGEQRVLQRNGRSVSILAGDIDTILAASRYRSDGRVLLTESDRAEQRLTAARAGEHGFVAVAIALRHFHTRVYEPDRHTWLGMAFLEPVYDEVLSRKLGLIGQSRLKFLSVLPSEFLHSVTARVRGSSQFAGIPPRQSTTPQEEEQAWEQNTTIGGADSAKRHAVCRYFESRRDCRLLSVLPDDEKLPITVCTHL
jgi:hypothetical protein